MGRLIQSTRQILDIHNNLLFQYEQLHIGMIEENALILETDEDMCFLALFSMFISLLSPYVYYSAVLTVCSKNLEQYHKWNGMICRAMVNPEVKAFTDAYNRYFNQNIASNVHENVSNLSFFDILSTPIKRVIFGNSYVTNRSYFMGSSSNVSNLL